MANALSVKQKASNLRDLLERAKGQIAIALPKHVTPERMLRVTMTAAQRSPALLDCEPYSLVGCVVQASQLGLEFDGVLGQAYLVPFRNKKTGQTECQLIPGYKGLIDLTRRSGQLSTIYAKVVHEHDKYHVAYGLEPTLTHEPADMDDAGPVVAAYAVARLRDGGTQYEWMWRREIEAIRKRSKAGTSGPWVTDYEEMAKKTVLRRLCKMLPVSVEIQRFVAQDEQFDAGVEGPAPSFDFQVPALQVERTGLDALTREIQSTNPDQPIGDAAAEEVAAGPSGTTEEVGERPVHPDNAEDAADVLAYYEAELGKCGSTQAVNALVAKLDDLYAWLPTGVQDRIRELAGEVKDIIRSASNAA